MHPAAGSLGEPPCEGSVALLIVGNLTGVADVTRPSGTERGTALALLEEK